MGGYILSGQKIENDLRELCKVMINELNRLKNNGLITEEEYKKHIKNKVEFLNRNTDER